MPKYQIITVSNKQQSKLFEELHLKLYNEYPHYVPTSLQELRKVFSSKNVFYREKLCQRFIAIDETGNCVGRVAAFVNPKTRDAGEHPLGGFGFYEAIDSSEVGRLLLEAAESFLKSLGISIMEGPCNLGEKDKFWGCVTSNYKDIPSYNQAFGLPHYPQHIRDFGMTVYYDQVIFGRRVDLPAQPIFVRKYQQAMKDESISVSHMVGKSSLEIAKDFVEVYNGAWGASYKDFKEMKLENAVKMIKSMEPIIDKKVLVFVYKDAKPIGFYISIPEVNEIMRKVGPNMNVWGKMKFLWYKQTVKPKNLVGLIFGVVKEHQGTGMEGVMIKWMEDHVLTKVSYKYTTLNWIGDFNPKMIKIAERLGSDTYRTLSTFRKSLVEGVEIERHPSI